MVQDSMRCGQRGAKEHPGDKFPKSGEFPSIVAIFLPPGPSTVARP